MLPMRTIGDATHGRLADAVFSAQPFLTNTAISVSMSNFSNLRLGQLTTPVFKTNVIASLLSTICIVVRERPEKQMIRAYAQTIVASVTNAQPIGNFTKGELVGDSVWADRIALSTVHISIAVQGASTCPQPTPACFVDVTPKTFLEGNALASSMILRVGTSNQVSVCHGAGR